MKYLIFIFLIVPLITIGQGKTNIEKLHCQGIADRVNIRSSPGLGGTIITQVDLGHKCIILSKSNRETINGYTDNWYFISFNNSSQKGYIFGQFISKPSRSTSASNVYLFIAEATTYSTKMQNAGTTDLVYDQGGKKIMQFYKSSLGGNIPDQNVVLLRGSDCNSYNLLTKMTRLISKADNNDVIIFYYNGHGNQNILSMYDRAMHHSEVANILKTSKAKRKLWIADSCHSGSMSNTATNPVKSNDLQTIIEHHDNDITFISSSQANQLSWSVSEFNSGVFTYYWLEGLKGDADKDNDKIVTLSEAFLYTQDNVRNYSHTMLSNIQTPYLSGLVDMQLPLAVLNQH